jgi:regulator of sigma E protease
VDWVKGALAVVVLFGAMISFHELGHFLVARLAGMRVHEYALGFGPILVSFRRGDIRYSLRVVPLGGFVRIAGMDPGDEDPNGFDKKSIPWRMATIAAGCAMNLAMAVLILAGVAYRFPAKIFPYVAPELVKSVVTSRIEEVMPGGPASGAGLRPGDKIVGINALHSEEVEALRRTIEGSGGRRLRVRIERKGSVLVVPVAPRQVEVTPGGKTRPMIGVVFSFTELGLPAAFVMGARMTYYFSAATLKGIGELATGKIALKKNVTGIVGASQWVAQQAKKGWGDYLRTCALITLFLAWFNLIPFPPLDGSRVVFLVVEAARGRPLMDKRKEAMVHLVGFALLLGLVVVITYFDVLRIWSGRPLGS